MAMISNEREIITVGILLGNGDGTFQSQTTYPTQTNPYSVTTADFNDDKQIDLAVSNYGTDTVTIFLGNGDGTFQSQKTYPLETYPNKTYATSVTTADFNGDKKTDLATTSYYTETVSIFLGNGDGTFRNPRTYLAGLGSEPQTVITGDFNDDNKVDLAVANHGANTVGIFLGNGDGTFKNQTAYSTGSFNPGQITTADFNGDNKTDLAVADYNDATISILLNDGTGTFLKLILFATGSNVGY